MEDVELAGLKVRRNVFVVALGWLIVLTMVAWMVSGAPLFPAIVGLVGWLYGAVHATTTRLVLRRETLCRQGSWRTRCVSLTALKEVVLAREFWSREFSPITLELTDSDGRSLEVVLAAYRRQDWYRLLCEVRAHADGAPGLVMSDRTQQRFEKLSGR